MDEFLKIVITNAPGMATAMGIFFIMRQIIETLRIDIIRMQAQNEELLDLLLSRGVLQPTDVERVKNGAAVSK